MKKIAIGSSCVLFFALAAFAVWWYVTPHSAREELERAEARVKAFLAKGGLSAEDRARWAEEIERAYRRVLDRYPESRYPEARVSHEQALWRLAEVYERTLKDPESALARYREFLKRFPASGRAEEAAWRIARLLGFTLPTVHRAIDEFNARCVAGLPDRPRSGRPPKASPEHVARLEKAVRPPRQARCSRRGRSRGRGNTWPGPAG